MSGIISKIHGHAWNIGAVIGAVISYNSGS